MSARVTRASEGQLASVSVKYKGQERASQFNSSGHGLAFVVEEEGEIVGWCWGYRLIRPDGETMIYIHEIEVDQDARRRGYGRLLIDAMLEAARAEGAAKMFLITEDSNDGAKALYESAGGRRSEEGESVVYRWVLGRGNDQPG